jgi:hypothetical protein
MKKESNKFPMSRSELLEWARRAVLDLFTQFAAKSGKSRWAEKTPAHVHHMELISEMFPGSQFIHIIRNGYDVVKSLQNMPWAPRRIGWSTYTWINSVHAGRQAGAKLGPSQYLEVRYEKLIQEPKSVLGELCQFLGEPFDAQLMGFHEPEKNSWKIRSQPLQNKPVHEYRQLGLWQRLAFAWSAGRLMRELGYQ